MPLIAGVAAIIKNLGSELDLRVRGVIWEGGYYNGLTALVSGGDYERESNNWVATFTAVS